MPAPLLGVSFDSTADTQTVRAGEELTVEVRVLDLRSKYGNPTGVAGLGLTITWDAALMDYVGDIDKAVTEAWPAIRSGRLGRDGCINNLGGLSLTAFNAGRSLGVNQEETCMTLVFKAERDVAIGTQPIKATVGRYSVGMLYRGHLRAEDVQIEGVDTRLKITDAVFASMPAWMQRRANVSGRVTPY